MNDANANEKAKPPVLILGGRSDIGMAVAHEFARRGHAIQLAARKAESLAADKTDLELRYAVPVSLHEFDALAHDTHEAFIESLPGLPQIAVSAIGLLGDQELAVRDPAAASLVMQSNFIAPANILSVIANRLKERGSGTIIGISSVAGERGRAKNYIYGAAKAGFTAYLSGLRNRLARSKSGVHVMTVLPGFVATRMTAGMDLPPALTAAPEEVARAIARAVDSKRDVIYTRPVWRIIMTIIRAIPEAVFKRMDI